MAMGWHTAVVAYWELTRPATLDETEWTALVQLVDRMAGAHQNAD
jgi:hypothetical protein